MRLGLDMGDGVAIDNNDTQLNFLMSVFQDIAEHNGNPQIIYPLFRDNLSLLEESLIPILTTWHQAKFAEVDEDGKQFISAVISEFADLIQQFPLGNRLTNLEIAIDCYRLALEVYTRAAHPEDWATTQMNLAVAYSNRIRGERAQNLEESIGLHWLALEVYTRAAHPERWAMTKNNLATAYEDRIRGNKAQNLEESIGCYRLALEVRTREAYPKDWATTQINLANAYSDRIRGERAQNLEESISLYRLALEVYTREAYPERWAMTQMNLAKASNNRIWGDKAQNIEDAISCYRLALEVRTRNDYPEDWAMTQNNLATAYGNRIQGRRAANLEDEIACYRLALEVRTREAYPEDWAMTQSNLANAYIERIDGERTMNLVIAIECFKSALTIRIPELLPLDCLHTSRNLGNLAFKQGNWQLAIDAYELAMRSVETSRSWATSDASRQEILQNSLIVYKNAIQAAINIGDYKLAIQYTERVRSRQLVELMASKDPSTEAEVTPEIKQHLQNYEACNHQIQAFRERANNANDTKGGEIQLTSRLNRQDFEIVSEKIGILEAEKQAIYKKIRAKDPLLAGSLAVDPIEWDQIQSLITSTETKTKTAILSYYSTDDDTHLFIIKKGQAPELFTCTGQGYHELQLWLQKSWSIGSPTWRSQMPSILAEISQRLQLSNLVTQHLDGIEELIILPHLYLHQIPFAALPLGDKEVLSDKFVIRSIPSCQILKYCVDRHPISEHIYGTVEDADGSLLGARYEGEQIARINNIKDNNRLRGQTQATIANYRKLLARVTRLHSSHHASSRLDNPLESALKLADGSITLGDLLLGQRYSNLDEVFLSACQTHVGKTTLTDDVTTLNTAFLCIGARSVQSTLWSVDDLVTALFDIFYHQFRQGGMNRAVALQQAQIRLRNLSGDEFRLNHYPQFSAYFGLEQLDLKMSDLEAQGLTTTQEFAELEQRYDQISPIVDTLKGYCEKSRPFKDPYYWAAFITQGMATPKLEKSEEDFEQNL